MPHPIGDPTFPMPISSDREARKALSHRGSGGENIAARATFLHNDEHNTSNDSMVTMLVRREWPTQAQFFSRAHFSVWVVIQLSKNITCFVVSSFCS